MLYEIHVPNYGSDSFINAFEDLGNAVEYAECVYEERVEDLPLEGLTEKEVYQMTHVVVRAVDRHTFRMEWDNDAMIFVEYSKTMASYPEDL